MIKNDGKITLEMPMDTEMFENMQKAILEEQTMKSAAAVTA